MRLEGAGFRATQSEGRSGLGVPDWAQGCGFWGEKWMNGVGWGRSGQWRPVGRGDEGCRIGGEVVAGGEGMSVARMGRGPRRDVVAGGERSG